MQCCVLNRSVYRQKHPLGLHPEGRDIAVFFPLTLMEVKRLNTRRALEMCPLTFLSYKAILYIFSQFCFCSRRCSEVLNVIVILLMVMSAILSVTKNVKFPILLPPNFVYVGQIGPVCIPLLNSEKKPLRQRTC